MDTTTPELKSLISHPDISAAGRRLCEMSLAEVARRNALQNGQEIPAADPLSEKVTLRNHFSGEVMGI